MDDNIKMVVEGIRVRCEGVDWIPMSQDMDQWDTFMNTVINFLVL
jgi:hypothetical protein